MSVWQEPDGEHDSPEPQAAQPPTQHPTTQRSTAPALGYGQRRRESELDAPLLRQHVDRILSASAVPDDDRGDVAEELYGHLYERWREAVESGMDPQSAARQAIAGFGDPETLGPKLTAAFHSRLYASTIGLLLPAAVPDVELDGYGRACAVLGIGAIADVILALLIAAIVPPLPALAGMVGCAYLALLSVLAIKAIGRGQRWAVVFVQLVCVVDLIAAIPAAALTGQRSIVAAGLVMCLDLWVIRGTRIPESWGPESAPLRKALVPFIVATTLVAYALPAGALAAPDPTQTTAADLSLTVSASCPQAGPWSVTAQLRWSRTDLLGGRLIPLINDQAGLSIGRNDGTAPGFPGDVTPAFDTDVTGGDLVDLATNATIHAELSEADLWTSAGGFRIGNRWFTIDPSSMHSGTTYETTFGMDGAEADAGALWGGRDGRFRVRYEHLGRWALEAIATCGQTVTAHSIPVR